MLKYSITAISRLFNYTAELCVGKKHGAIRKEYELVGVGKVTKHEAMKAWARGRSIDMRLFRGDRIQTVCIPEPGSRRAEVGLMTPAARHELRMKKTAEAAWRSQR